jgi:hypothetical protein
MAGSKEIVPQEYEEQEGSLHHLEVNPGGATGGGGAVEELPECPEYYPTTFIKGKPRSIFTLSYISKELIY